MSNSKQNSEQNNSETLMEFPCDFPLKIMGNNHPDFLSSMCDLVSLFIDHELDLNKIIQRPSSSGKYLAVTLTFTAKNKQQIDNIYQALYEHEDVKMTL